VNRIKFLTKWPRIIKVIFCTEQMAKNHKSYILYRATGDVKAVYIVNDPKVATVLIDPMRRAILELLRQKPMTQAQLANELGLSAPSLNFHIKRLRSRKLVVIAKKEIEKHRIMQIFFASVAYLFVYDLESLPKNIGRYFFPVSLERARSILSTYYISRGRNDSSINYTCEDMNKLAVVISDLLVKAAKHYLNKELDIGRRKRLILYISDV
jgi:DNA-binding transcriptional ArsR family regulator